MNDLAAAQVPQPDDPRELLVSGRVTMICLRDGRSWKIKRVTHINETAKVVRFIPHNGKAETVDLDMISEVHAP